MKITYIYHTDTQSGRLLLIFAGWSTDPEFYSDITLKGWDIAVVNDYSDMDIDLSDILSRYSTIYIIAWSLGVAVAEHLTHRGIISHDRIAAAYAVNGTAIPVSEEFGIPDKIYDGTERTLSPDNLRRFLRRMCTSRDKFHPYPLSSSDCSQDIDSLRLQLRNISEISLSPILPWLKAYISENDLIIPADAQKRYWEGHKVSIVTLPAGHYVPISYIARMVTPDIERIGARFGSAHRYDDHAEAQHHIAEHLMSMIPEEMTSCREILELGTGTGYFSRLLARRLHPMRMTMVDLYMTRNMSLVPDERHYVADAERYINELPSSSQELIASASTMQWFTDPHSFIRNAARVLTDEGMLLCSSFLPGNLSELEVIRPTSMPYRSEEWLRKTLERYFKDVYIETEEITIEFTNRRELLLHLRHTGVGGSAVESDHHWTALPEYPKLTYRPIYIRALHPVN